MVGQLQEQLWLEAQLMCCHMKVPWTSFPHFACLEHFLPQYSLCTDACFGPCRDYACMRWGWSTGLPAFCADCDLTSGLLSKACRSALAQHRDSALASQGHSRGCHEHSPCECCMHPSAPATMCGLSCSKDPSLQRLACMRAARQHSEIGAPARVASVPHESRPLAVSDSKKRQSNGLLSQPL